MRFPSKTLAPALAALALVACTEHVDTPQDPAKNEPGPAKNYLVALKGTHAHIYKKVVQLFTVYDLDTCTDAKDLTTCRTVTGLKPVAFLREPGSAYVTRQELGEGVLEDNGNGTFAFYTQFVTYGAHTIGLEFTEDGRTYFGAFALESAKGGGERFFCDTNADSTTDFAFQVRWSASVGQVVADGKTAVRFSLELLRTFAGASVNTTEPWTNSFDHLTPADLESAPVVKLMAGPAASAETIATLAPTYKGKGIYDVTHTFDAPQLAGAMQRTFWLSIAFTDKGACTVDSATAVDEYTFPVDAAMPM